MIQMKRLIKVRLIRIHTAFNSFLIFELEQWFWSDTMIDESTRHSGKWIKLVNLFLANMAGSLLCSYSFR